MEPQGHALGGAHWPGPSEAFKSVPGTGYFDSGDSVMGAMYVHASLALTHVSLNRHRGPSVSPENRPPTHPALCQNHLLTDSLSSLSKPWVRFCLIPEDLLKDDILGLFFGIGGDLTLLCPTLCGR
ncbi:hypothetical protein AAFF_G00146740 [Aldrovandia affinis]|uniref:Uncharacterized protein n=1 Tax=Aldrovandia affinis TaxID=143900 RepID=A0AAD7RS84_9TELE|nr:hypothetical protein AAFF_G00146740 [Aldrovandia affinis]